MKNLMKRIFSESLFWLSCFIFLSVVAWVQPWKHEQPSLRDQLGAGGINGPFVVFRFDPRSAHGREFVATIDDAVQEHALALPVVLLLERERKVTFSDNVHIRYVDDHQHAIKTNQYALISENDSVVLNGPIHHQPGDLREAIYDYFNIEYQHPKADLVVGDLLEQTVFKALAVKEILPAKGHVKVWVAFQDVCFSCESGKRLAWLEEIANHYDETSFELLLIEDIPASEIAAFIEDYAVSIPLRKAPGDIRDYWFETMNEHRYTKHPLQGSFIAIDHRGKVLFQGQNDAALLSLLNQGA